MGIPRRTNWTPGIELQVSRLLAGVSQYDIAVGMGVPQPGVSRAEKEGASPRYTERYLDALTQIVARRDRRIREGMALLEQGRANGIIPKRAKVER